MEASNVKAMRKALGAIRKALLLDSGMGPCTEFHAEVDRLTATALAEPPRNCDVGSPAEQTQRFSDFCHGRNCDDCPASFCFRGDYDCSLAWAQMPYAAKEGDAK